MAQTIGIGHQDFEVVRRENCFYIDKTQLIQEWWNNKDLVTLITRPRRFGKTLAMSMLEKFFSLQYAGRDDLFQGLRIWENEEFRKLQGTYPVICLSFANIKDSSYETIRKKICQLLSNLYSQYEFLLNDVFLNKQEKRFFQSVSANMDDATATIAIYQLSGYISRYYRKKVIILLDEYDTPMQEAYVNGYWQELVSFTRSLFNSSFKANPYLERAIMTGITRVSRESVFSDLNNLEVVTTTSEKYSDCFGFTQQEVYASLDAFGLSDRKAEVKYWYDGFTFGCHSDIYNPWSILNFLDKKRLAPYWANSSSNALVGTLMREGSKSLKTSFEALLRGQTITAQIDEQIIYNQLDNNEQAVWSLLLASGYLKVKGLKTYISDFGEWKEEYTLEITNFEVRTMFRSMVRGWFGSAASVYNDFIRALLTGNVEAMNTYMNRVALATFSYFDTGKNPSWEEPERFYHGFVLGLMVELADRYVLTSNRESGFGRYDVMLEPRKPEDDGIILEFKVQDPVHEKELSDTVEEALRQIEAQKYDSILIEKGISEKKIRKYGFAFRGKEVLIGSN